MTDVAAQTHRRRSIHRLRTGRGRTVFALVVALAAILAVPALVVAAAHTIANSREGKAVTIGTSSSVTKLPDTPGALLVEKGRDGEVVGLTVFAVAPGGKGGSIVVVPAGTAVSPNGLGTPTRLAAAYATGGLDAQRQAVEGFLGVTLSEAGEADQNALAALLEPYQPFRVTLDEPVVDTRADGTDATVADKGTQNVTAAQMAQLLLARRVNESEINRLPRTAALWRAVAASMVAKGSAGSVTVPATSARDHTPQDVAQFLATLAAGGVAVHEVQVQPVLDKARNPDGVDLLDPDVAGVRLLMAQVLPGSVSPTNGNIRVRLVNPLGDPQLTYAAVARLAYVGANVVIVNETPGSAPARSTIEYHQADKAAEAGLYAPVLGGADVRPNLQRIDGIDVTMTLGESFRTFMASESAKTTTTTTAADTTTSGTSTTTTTGPPTTTKRTTGTTTKGKKRG